jgi:hypothetical protein
LVIAPTVKNLTIAGAGSGDTVIDAGPLGNRAFQITSGASVTMQGIAIINGSAPGGSAGAAGAPGQPGANGGAILNQGTLTLDGTAITNSKAGAGGSGGAGSSGSGADGGAGGSGGAVYSTGSLTLKGATIGNDSAGNGGAGGTGVQGDTGTNGGKGGAAGVGGGVENAGGTLVVTGSTIRGNAAGNGGAGGNGGTGNTGAGGKGGDGRAGANGGGIWSDGGTLSVTNSTFASNSAGAGGTGGSGGPGNGGNGGDGGSGGTGGNGGGVGAANPSSATLLQVTAAGDNAGAGGTGGTGGTGSTPGNQGQTGLSGAGGGVFDQGSAITVRNSLLSVNNGGNCSGSVLDGGFNLSFGDSSCPSTFASGDPNLGPLQDNGGPAPTISLQPGSAAINQIPASGSNCTATDERGVPRPQGSSSAKCDIGAYEVTGPGAVTGPATKVSLTGATLNAAVTPNAGTSSVIFQYGTTTAYGAATSVQHIGGVTATPVTATLSGLKPKTTYHYRIVIVAMDGTAIGGDRTFTTSVKPAIAGLSITPKQFRASRGATISYRDSKAATTTLTAFRCIRFKRGRCTRYKRFASFRHADIAGRNNVTIRHRFGHRALVGGSYKLQLTPRLSGKAGRTVSTTFRVT